MFRTSAKTGENVELAVESLVKLISFNIDNIREKKVVGVEKKKQEE